MSMSKRELIEELENLDVPDDTPVTIPIYAGMGFDDVRFVRVVEAQGADEITIIALEN